MTKKTSKATRVVKKKEGSKKKIKSKKIIKKPVKKPIKKVVKKLVSKKSVKKPVKKVVKKPVSKPKSKKIIKKYIKRKTIKPKKVIKKKPVEKSIKPKVKKIVKKKIKTPTKKKVTRGPVKKTVKKITKKTKPRKIVRKPESRKIIRRKIKLSKRTKKSPKPRAYIGKGALDQLFESQAKVKLLRLFFRNAEEMFQPKDIFRMLRVNVVILKQEMKKLEKLGLISQKKAWLTFENKKGNTRKEQKVVWYANPAFDFFNELKSLILKTAVASKDDLVSSVKKTGNIKLLVLTGVFTRDETASADLLIVGDKINSRKLNNFIKDVEAEVGGEVKCAVMTTKEFNYRYDMYDRFVRDLITGKSEILIKRITLW